MGRFIVCLMMISNGKLGFDLGIAFGEEEHGAGFEGGMGWMELWINGLMDLWMNKDLTGGVDVSRGRRQLEVEEEDRGFAY